MSQQSSNTGAQIQTETRNKEHLRCSKFQAGLDPTSSKNSKSTYETLNSMQSCSLPSLIIYVDSRETDVLSYLKQEIENNSRNLLSSDSNIDDLVQSVQMDVGDFGIGFKQSQEQKFQLQNLLLIFERKTKQDLIQSIKTQRYKDQKGRLLDVFNPQQISYIIETGKNHLYDSDKKLSGFYVNTQYRDNIKVFLLDNLKQTAQLLYHILFKIRNDKNYLNVQYLQNNQNTDLVKHQTQLDFTKKKYVSVFQQQLQVINGVSKNVADAIIQESQSQNSFQFVQFLQNQENIQKIKNIRVNNRKVNKNVITQVILNYSNQ